MRHRFVRSRLLGMLGAVGLPLSLPLASRAAETYTLRMEVSTAAESANALAAIRLAQTVSRRSNGQLQIEVYPNNQLVNEAGSIQGLLSGLVDVMMEVSSFLVPLLPQYQIFDTPFLFRNTASSLRILDGPIGQDLFAQLEPKGIMGLAWGSDGFRILGTTGKKVVTVEDMRGLRVRVQGASLPTATFGALGAIPVVIDGTELYTALSQRTVDAIDFPLVSIVDRKLYTYIRHCSMTNHVFAVVPLFANKRKIEGLPPNLQKIFKDECKAMTPYWRALTAEHISAAGKFLQTNGVTYSEIQYAGFRRAMDPLYASVQSKIGGDLIDRIGKLTAAG